MIEIYAALILAGRKTIDDVPGKIKEDVKNALLKKE